MADNRSLAGWIDTIAGASLGLDWNPTIIYLWTWIPLVNI